MVDVMPRKLACLNLMTAAVACVNTRLNQLTQALHKTLASEGG